MNDQLFYSPSLTNGVLEAADAVSAENGFFNPGAVQESMNPWDQAHLVKKTNPELNYVEPDLINQNPDIAAIEQSRMEEGETEGAISLAVDEYDPNWPFPEKNDKPLKMIWHVNDAFAQLKSAWTACNDSENVIRIAHFDTGYDPTHITFPQKNIESTLQKNFVEGNDNAVDIQSEGWFKMPGHGTGTLSILAGNLVTLPAYQYQDYIGIHHKIRIVPVRVSKSVILWKNKAFVDALEYIISLYDNPATRCHIVSMSMGGLPSQAWADVVNRAYEKGIFIVTAAGNNYGRLTPTTLVYPARFGRVTAACGVNFDYAPYFKKFSISDINVMEGNFGPRKVMQNAIAAFTPNVPWALINSIDKVSINGAGTSSATPQVAAAAALYYQKYYSEIEALKEGWKKVETIRQAMFNTASPAIKDGYDNDVQLYFGNGVLQAKKMLDQTPGAFGISKQQTDVLRWPFLKLVTGTDILESALLADEDTLQMYEMEILQLISKSLALQQILDMEEKGFDELGPETQRAFYQTILAHPDASDSLKNFIMDNNLV